MALTVGQRSTATGERTATRGVLSTIAEQFRWHFAMHGAEHSAAMTEPRSARNLLPPGAHCDTSGTTFVVVSTRARSVAVRLFDEHAQPLETIELSRDDDARFSARLNGAKEGALYKFILDGDEVPDPYARFLPFGVHGPARVLSSRPEPPLAAPPALHRWSIYELHVGTFTRAGTFRGAIDRLDHVASVGVTAIELLPVAAFSGSRGWGYDGVSLYAPHAAYGSPDDLRALVRAAHERGLAVILDAVYNHFGPSGNYLSRYAPEYFTSRVKTPWGDAPDYRWAPMRRLVLDSARYWLDELGFDGLRLDATHEIHDDSDPHLLSELTALAHERGRRVFFEDERNDPDVVHRLGADGVWADDFHHQLHVLLTGERDGYYAAYEPSLEALAANIRNGWTFAGAPYAPWGGRMRGKPLGALERERLVTCIQNHDQVGNRALGKRLSALVSADAYRSAIVLSLFLPSTPLLFMGQEWAASSPFLYFTDHGGDLGAAVSSGRRDEFKSFAAFADPSVREHIPDPEALSTFEASRLPWDELAAGDHARALDLHRAMFRLRRDDAVLSEPSPVEARIHGGTVLEVVRRSSAGARTLLVNFDRAPRPFSVPGGGRVLLRSDAGGDVLAPYGAILFAS
ncbi:MAG: Malto-oligosyltrehalose trehalohydrolase [Labilithrix sp.]|nr:Malto-oligosyltrehalose trehalohydrolase [Labilithrix sp.]